MHKSCATVFDNFISMQANKNLINIFLNVIVELSPLYVELLQNIYTTHIITFIKF